MVDKVDKIWFDGKLIPWEQANVHVLTHTLHYGLGVFVDGRRNAFGHGGMWPGYRTDVSHFRDLGITVAVQANSDQGFDTEGLMDRIVALWGGNQAAAG